jgi:hypothetical protein
MKRGRRSAADNVVALPSATRPTLIPLSRLKTTEQKYFDNTAREAVHMGKGDVPLLMAFAITSARLMATKNASDFDRLGRLSIMLATKLRLTPQARVHPATLSRAVKNKHVWDESPSAEGDDDAG